jgi:hypothetical protein
MLKMVESTLKIEAVGGGGGIAPGFSMSPARAETASRHMSATVANNFFKVSSPIG